MFLRKPILRSTKDSLNEQILRLKSEIYACVNKGEAFTSLDIKERSICIDCDIAEVLKKIKK